MRYLTLLLLRLVPFSCADSETKQNLVGTWKYDMEATLAEMQKRGAVQADLNYIQSILIGLKEASISFEPDGNLVFSIADEKEEGTWKLQEKDKMLILGLNGSEQRSIIESINVDTLILLPAEEEEGFLRVLTGI